MSNGVSSITSARRKGVGGLTGGSDISLTESADAADALMVGEGSQVKVADVILEQICYKISSYILFYVLLNLSSDYSNRCAYGHQS